METPRQQAEALIKDISGTNPQGFDFFRFEATYGKVASAPCIASALSPLNRRQSQDLDKHITGEGQEDLEDSEEIEEADEDPEDPEEIEEADEDPED